MIFQNHFDILYMPYKVLKTFFTFIKKVAKNLSDWRSFLYVPSDSLLTDRQMRKIGMLFTALH